ncbi:MAG: monovalent cation:proton antiporter family protein [Salibacteraceae bacterium]
MSLPLLPDIVIILGLAVVINLLFQRIKIPTILGFLLTGIVAGPNGLNLISATHEVELLAEIGIIFLLFVIGIEFSIKSLISIRNTVIWGGLIQVVGTIGVTYLVGRWVGLPMEQAVFLGFLFSLSSTAIVLKMLQERGEITAPHGRVSIAILIFQDIIVVPMMLLTPILGGASDDIGNTLLLMGVKVVGVVVLVILLARYIVPVLLKAVVRTKSRELFLLTVVVLCFATAWLTSSAGLSLALGAFFAGLIISESDYSHQATANILPFREIFISFFFVSVGMLLDFSFFIDHIVYIHLIAIGVLIAKMAIIALAALILGYPPRTIILSALSLFQVGEFAFLLATTGMPYDLLPERVYQYFLAVSIITMGATPFIIAYSSQLASLVLKAPLPKGVQNRLNRITKSKAQMEAPINDICHDHLVIIGYGLNGQNVAKTAKQANIPYVIVDMNADTYHMAKEKGEPVVFGDASDETILRHVHVHEARVVVIAISDPRATINIVSRIRLFTETAYVVVRTRYLREIEELIKKGADEVIPEEFETSIEIFTRVLKKYMVPSNEISDFITRIRADNYDALRRIDAYNAGPQGNLSIPDIEIVTLSVQQGKNKIIGKSLKDSELRSTFDVTVLAIKRSDEYIIDLTSETTILQDDVLYVFGRPENIAQLNGHLSMV